MDLKIFGIAVSLVVLAAGVVFYETSMEHFNVVEVRSPSLCNEALKKVAAQDVDEKKELEAVSYGVFPPPDSNNYSVQTIYYAHDVTQVSSGGGFACSGTVFRNSQLLYKGKALGGASRSEPVVYSNVLFDANGAVYRHSAK